MSKDLYQVEEIVGFKHVRGAPHYRVRWLGYNSRHDTWEPESNLSSCDDLIEEYHSRALAAKKETRYKTRRSLAARQAGNELSGGDEVSERPLRRSQRARTPITYYTSEIPTRRRRSLTPKPTKRDNKSSTESDEEVEPLDVHRSEYELRSRATPRKSPRHEVPTHYFNSELPNPRRSPHQPKSKKEEEEQDEVTNTYELRSQITNHSPTVSSMALSSDEEGGDVSSSPQISDFESNMRKRLSNLSKLTRKSMKDVLTTLTAEKTDPVPPTKPVQPSTSSRPPKMPTVTSSHVYETRSHTAQSEPPTARIQLRSSKPSVPGKGEASIDGPELPPEPSLKLPASSDVARSQEGLQQAYPEWMQLGWEEVMFTLLIVGLVIFAYYCFYSDRC